MCYQSLLLIRLPIWGCMKSATCHHPLLFICGECASHKVILSLSMQAELAASSSDKVEDSDCFTSPNTLYRITSWFSFDLFYFLSVPKKEHKNTEICMTPHYVPFKDLKPRLIGQWFESVDMLRQSGCIKLIVKMFYPPLTPSTPNNVPLSKEN